MYPLQHVVSSGAAVLAFAVLSGVDPSTAVVWLVLSTLLTTVVDLDHFIVLVFNRKKHPVMLKLLSDPFKRRSVVDVRNMLHFPGFGWIRLLTHLLAGAVLLYAVHSFSPSLLLPAYVSLLTHYLTDLFQTIALPSHR